jgi:formate hydrogenlyase subunit 6/NADH:ubiquinone oxidoreductase subunit I
MLGGKLQGAFSVRLPMNNLDYGHVPFPINTDHLLMHKQCERKLISISRRIGQNRAEPFRLGKNLFYVLLSPMLRLMVEPILAVMRTYAKEPKESSLPMREILRATDKSITVSDSCNGCSLCSRICPVRNIAMVDGKPTWLHHCEMCFACDEWCPQGAIHHWSRAVGIKYHHPSVTLKDMLPTKAK